MSEVIVTFVIVAGPPASGVYVQVPANDVPRLKVTEVVDINLAELEAVGGVIKLSQAPRFERVAWEDKC